MDALERSVRIGYRAVAEQYPPQRLLEFAVDADRQGFEFVSIPDHFHPWFHAGGHAAFAWTWIASAAERTKTVKLGTGVTTPIHRYHPAIVAQAFATLGAMYPGRIFLGLGTGEAMNEYPISGDWPRYGERVEMIEEALTMIRRLWSEEFVTLKGKYFTLRDANIYDKPVEAIPVYVAASGPTMAEMAGRSADGLYTTTQKEEFARDVLIASARRGAKQAGRSIDEIDLAMLCNISWDEDYDRALRSIMRWRGTARPGSFTDLVWDPRRLDELAAQTSMDDLTPRWTICTDLEDAIKSVEACVRMGFNSIEVRSCSPDEKRFIKLFGERAIPYIKQEYGGR